MSSFVHLHNHTHYSLLDGACRIGDLIAAAKQHNMDALAITDHGNMFGAVKFYQKAIKSGIRPIIGLETYVAPGSRLDKTSERGGRDAYFHLLLLAKNYTGYQNLMRLSSIGFLEGFYYKPRIDREVLDKYKEGLIVLSSCIMGEVPYKLIHQDFEGAKKAAIFYRTLFGDDFYLEIQNHGLPEESIALQGLKTLSSELSIPLVATNDIHYIKKEDAKAQEVLLCIQTNTDLKDENRFKFNSDQNYFRSPDEMSELFSDVPDALTKTLEIAEKCNLVMEFDTVHMPSFDIPQHDQELGLNGYLEKMARDGLKQRYETVTKEIEDRLSFELSTIADMKYAGYFLIVQDFIDYAKARNIPVGPGRGSAAGSLVSFCLGITDVDPIKYGLLFERFLNPARKSMPDIDIDFCYEKRDKIIDYVVNKYGGVQNVTQIITFGSMNARAVIRDVGRVLQIPLTEVDKIAKMIPYNWNLQQTYKKNPEFRHAVDNNDNYEELYQLALTLEGLARHSSIHAAGVVIAPDVLTNFVPLFKTSQGDITTQYDKGSVEAVGLLKMDFLGLRTLTVIDYTLKALKKRGIEIDIQDIPLNDAETYRIFADGKTVGIFQFESAGMRDYLKKLQPTSIEELTAMNALYRPGPMDNINNFIDRKFGRAPVEYHHPTMEKVLKETYGIIVYQEQVMQLANIIGGFSLAEADILRWAMGKKEAELMQEQRERFVQGAMAQKIPQKLANTIFDEIHSFAGYGFNKSHATCYSIVAYQTAFLKAHYPNEFMAANLTSEMGDTDRVVILIDECRRMGIDVLPPDVRESHYEFTVVEGGIRFGLGAVKNTGKAAIESIIESREKALPSSSIFDFCRTLDFKNVNKKVLESLIQVGAMDSMEGSRAQQLTVLPTALGLAQTEQQRLASGQTTMFDAQADTDLLPELPEIEPWPYLDLLRREKSLLGFYLSGHPLEKYADELNAFAKPEIRALQEAQPGLNVNLCGIITRFSKKFDRKNQPMAFFDIEDFSGSIRVVAFSETYEKYGALFEEDRMVMVKGQMSNRDSQDRVSVVASEAYQLETVRSQFARRLVLQVSSVNFTETLVDEIKGLIRKHPGLCEIIFSITNDEKNVLLRSKSWKVNPVPELMLELRELLNKEDVWIEG